MGDIGAVFRCLANTIFLLTSHSGHIAGVYSFFMHSVDECFSAHLRHLASLKQFELPTPATCGIGSSSLIGIVFHDILAKSMSFIILIVT